MSILDADLCLFEHSTSLATLCHINIIDTLLMRPPYMHETIESVWRQADVVEGVNPDIWRKDFAGAWIRRDYLGMHNLYGWSIDYRKPITAGGSNAPDNLMPMHWRNKEQRNGGYPEFQSIISSDRDHNVEKIKAWRFKG